MVFHDAEQSNAFFGIVVIAISLLGREVIVERRAGHFKRNAMAAPVSRGFAVVPLEGVILHNRYWISVV
jgi:hypothetical protein